MGRTVTHPKEYAANEERAIMPTNSAPELAAPQHDPHSIVSVSIKRAKPSHRLVLHIDAKNLHDLLDSVGVPRDGNTYADRPACTYRVANGDNLSTELFLKREYPVTVDLSQILTSPVAHSRLEALATSAKTAVTKILEHYQPVDIQISVQGKLV